MGMIEKRTGILNVSFAVTRTAQDDARFDILESEKQRAEWTIAQKMVQLLREGVRYVVVASGWERDGDPDLSYDEYGKTIVFMLENYRDAQVGDIVADGPPFVRAMETNDGRIELIAPRWRVGFEEPTPTEYIVQWVFQRNHVPLYGYPGERIVVWERTA